MSYEKDRAWSDIFIPQIKQIVGPLLLMETPYSIDVKQAADLMVLDAKDRRIAARIRRSGFADKYGGQFTIRSKRDSGSETELKKIVDGFGDWFFYGHENNGQIGLWHLLDLDVFRASLIREGFYKNRKILYGEKPNGDGTYFMWFDINSFPKELVIAKSY